MWGLAPDSPFYAFVLSDWFGRLVVLVLLGASVLAWTIMVERWLCLRAAERLTATALGRYGQLGAPEHFLVQLPQFEGPLQRVAQAVLGGMATVLGRPAETLVTDLRRPGAVHLRPDDLPRLRAVALAAADEELMRLETRMSLLSCIVAASPFLGLLGTVWGIMLAFLSVAAKGRADIGALAPGVSGALLTTVVGLLVAIPAVLGYNLLVTRIRALTVRIDHFTEDLLTALQARFAAPPDQH